MTEPSAAANEMLRMSAQDFRSIVDKDIRGELADPIAAILHDPIVAPRWVETLRRMLTSVNAQLVAKEAEARAVEHRLQGAKDGAKDSEWLIENARFQRWKVGAIRFRSGVEERLSEACAYLPAGVEAPADASSEMEVLRRQLADARFERDEALRRSHMLEMAIRRHRDELLYGDDEPTPGDEALWSNLPN